MYKLRDNLHALWSNSKRGPGSLLEPYMSCPGYITSHHPSTLHHTSTEKKIPKTRCHWTAMPGAWLCRRIVPVMIRHCHTIVDNALAAGGAGEQRVATSQDRCSGYRRMNYGSWCLRGNIAGHAVRHTGAVPAQGQPIICVPSAPAFQIAMGCVASR
eukprot:jgi/Ulvmu1/5426/UM022_0221.1